MNPDVVKQKVRDHLRTCFGCEKCYRWREELQKMKRLREEQQGNNSGSQRQAQAQAARQPRQQAGYGGGKPSLSEGSMGGKAGKPGKGGGVGLDYNEVKSPRERKRAPGKRQPPANKRQKKEEGTGAMEMVSMDTVVPVDMGGQLMYEEPKYDEEPKSNLPFDEYEWVEFDYEDNGEPPCPPCVPPSPPWLPSLALARALPLPVWP